MMFRFFNSHTYLLSSVAFRLSKEFNDALWFASLVLNEFSVRPTYVCGGLLVGLGSFVLNSDFSLIYNRFGDTFIRQWAQYFIVFWATTHVKAIRGGSCRQRGFVVFIDSLLNVWHTAVADLDCITVEYFYILTIWWIIPYNFSFTASGFVVSR